MVSCLAHFSGYQNWPLRSRAAFLPLATISRKENGNREKKGTLQKCQVSSEAQERHIHVIQLTAFCRRYSLGFKVVTAARLSHPQAQLKIRCSGIYLVEVTGSPTWSVPARSGTLPVAQECRAHVRGGGWGQGPRAATAHTPIGPGQITSPHSPACSSLKQVLTW